MTDLIQVSSDHGVLAIKMCRPDKKNALTGPMYLEMTRHLLLAAKREDVGCVVLTGVDGCFSSGNDIEDFTTFTGDMEFHPGQEFLRTLADFEKPIVAAVESIAVGVGVTMLLHCDFIYASDDTTFQMPFVHLALVPEAASSLLLPSIIGYHRAAELLLLGKPFDAKEGHEFGIVNGVFSRGEVVPQALKTARKIASLPRDAVRFSKALLKRQPEPVGARMVAELDLFQRQLESDEAKKIFASFLKKTG